MFRVKHFAAAALLALSMLASAASVYADDNDDLIDSNDIVSDKGNYNTVHPEYGTYTDETKTIGSVYIPKRTAVVYKGFDATFVGDLVKYGSIVEEGDPLFEIRIEADDYTISSAELKLTRAKEALESETKDYNEDINTLYKDYYQSTDAYSQKVIYLNIQKKKLELEKYTYEQERTIAQLEKELEEIREKSEIQYITAPVSGMVMSLEFITENEPLYSGTKLCEIADISSMMIKINDANFTAGMSVNVEAGGNSNGKLQAEGTVVVSSNIIDLTANPYALIRPDLQDYNFSSVSINTLVYAKAYVSGETAHLENVLVIPQKACYSSNTNNFYVVKYTPDGGTHKRYINTGLYNRDQVWVIYGLSADDVLILD